MLSIGALVLAACSLAQDITPPPGAESWRASGTPAAVLPTLPATAAVSPAPEDTVPRSRPSAEDGAALFAENCAACHGATGKGDGTMAAQLLEQRPGPLPDFSSPELARQTAPEAWFQTITNGRMDKFMPPWRDSLSVQQRWNLVAFLYTLSTPPDQIETGQAVYAANCAQCHGAEGKGDGSEATGADLPDFSDPAYMAQANPQQFFEVVTTGAGIAEHAFGTLSEAERWAVIDYVRAIAFEYVAPGTPPREKTGEVTGQVINRTGGADVPAGLQVSLRGYENFAEVVALTTTVESDGAFVFGNVPYRAGRSFLAFTRYQDITYGTDLFTFETPQVDLGPAINIYEGTTDTTALRIERMHIFFDFPAQGDGVTVGELFLLSNQGDRTIVPQDGRTAQFTLPESARDLTVQNRQEGVDYVRTADGLALTTPIQPGTGVVQVLLSFKLPFQQQLDFAQRVNYPASVLNVLTTGDGVTVSGGGLQDQGLQTAQGLTFRGYSLNGVKAGEVVTFELTREATLPFVGTDGTTQWILAAVVGLGVFALTVGVGLWWLRRSTGRREAPDDDEEDVDEEESLLQEMADLDDAFEAGEIAEDAYQKERARLKEELLRLREED